MYQRAPDEPSEDPVVTIDDNPLKCARKFCYLGNVIANNTQIDDEISQHIAEASAAYGRLTHRLWSTEFASILRSGCIKVLF